MERLEVQKEEKITRRCCLEERRTFELVEEIRTESNLELQSLQKVGKKTNMTMHLLRETKGMVYVHKGPFPFRTLKAERINGPKQDL